MKTPIDTAVLRVLKCSNCQSTKAFSPSKSFYHGNCLATGRVAVNEYEVPRTVTLYKPTYECQKRRRKEIFGKKGAGK